MPHFADAATPPTLASAHFAGGAGDQDGRSVTITGGRIHIGTGSGQIVRYTLPPIALTSGATLPGTSLDGLASTASVVYSAGAAIPPSCGASDGVGSTERKSMLARLDVATGSVSGCQAVNFFPYRGYEGYTAAVLQGSDLFVVGNAETCGFGNNTFILAKYDLSGNLVDRVGEPGTNFSSPACAGGSSGQAVASWNGNLYVAGSSKLASEDGVDRPVLMRYSSSLARDWKRRPTEYGGAFAGVTAFGGAIYAVGYAGSSNIDFLIEKYDELGNRIWTKTSGGPGQDSLNAVIAVGNRLFAVGSTSSAGSGGTDAVILEIDPVTGDTLSTTTYGGSQNDSASAAATDGFDLYVVGTSSSFASADGNLVGQMDVMLLRYSILSTINTTTTVAAAAGQYSDAVTLSAVIGPSGSVFAGSLQFKVDGVDAGLAVPVSGPGTYTTSYTITLPAGPHIITAALSTSTVSATGSNGSATLTVSRENASITPDPTNPQSVPAGPATLKAKLEQANDGSPGDLNRAAVTVTLTPLVGSGVVTCPVTNTAGVLSASCPPLAVNVYTVQWSIGGDYFTGPSVASVLGVASQTLALVTGNGSLVIDGIRRDFDVLALNQATGLQAGLQYVEHRPGGDVKVATTSPISISVVGKTAVLLARATINGTGNFLLRAILIDNIAQPVLTRDRFGLQVGTISFAPEAILAGGDIQVN